MSSSDDDKSDNGDSSQDDNNSTESNDSEYDSGGNSDEGGKKKHRKVSKKQPPRKKSAAAAAPTRRSTDRKSAEPFAQLVSAALKSHKKQEQNRLIDEVKSDVMGILQAKLLGGEPTTTVTHKKDSSSSSVAGNGATTMKRDYMKRIRSAYKDMKKHNTIGVSGGKFGSEEHKANISSLFSKLDQVHDVDLKHIPDIDQALDIDNILGDSSASGRMKITKLGKKHIQSSPDKVISEAEYNSLTNAYGACILYRYFFLYLNRI